MATANKTLARWQKRLDRRAAVADMGVPSQEDGLIRPCKKLKFVSRIAALNTQARRMGHLAYKCPNCGCWHTTSKPNRRSKESS